MTFPLAFGPKSSGHLLVPNSAIKAFLQTTDAISPERQADLIETLVESGRYQNASEVLRDGLRLVEQREAEDASKLKALRAAARVGVGALDRGEFKEFRNTEDLQASLNDLAEKVISKAAGSTRMAERKRRVRLGAVAELDFANIVKWTTENFGARQSRVYQKTLVQAIGELAKRRIGGARFDPIRAAARLRSGPGALTQFPPGPSCKLARIGEGRSRRAHWVVAVSGGPQTLSEATATLILRFGGTGMKKLCIGVVAVVLIICGPALAADMPAKAPAYKAAPP